MPAGVTLLTCRITSDKRSCFPSDVSTELITSLKKIICISTNRFHTANDFRRLGQNSRVRFVLEYPGNQTLQWLLTCWKPSKHVYGRRKETVASRKREPCAGFLSTNDMLKRASAAPKIVGVYQCQRWHTSFKMQFARTIKGTYHSTGSGDSLCTNQQW